MLQKKAAGSCAILVLAQVNRKHPIGSAYLTVAGSVADTGDVGVDDRGNQINGLIAPMRPQSSEAVSGKNPIDHTGKLYSLLAQRIAVSLRRTVGREVEVFVRVLKHEPLTEPGAVIVRTALALSAREVEVCNQIVDREIRQITAYLDELVGRGVRFC